MRKLFAFVALFCSTYDLTCQEGQPLYVKEYYIGVNSISPIMVQFTYKKQFTDKVFWKFAETDLSGNFNRVPGNGGGSFPLNQYGYSAGILGGIEFRKFLYPHLTFFHGPNLGYNYFSQTQKSFDPAIPKNRNKNRSDFHTAEVPYSIGVLFNVAPNIFLSFELNASIRYTWMFNYEGSKRRSSSNYLQASFQNNPMVSLVYRP